MTNADQFKRDFGKLLLRIGDRAETFVRKAAIEVGTSLVMKSPVDTGRFRANWQFGIGSVNKSTTTSTDAGGGDAVGRIAKGVAQWGGDKIIYMTNSLPYARRLEYGWSKQAPNGMVRLTVAEFETAVRRALKASKS